MGFFRQEYWSGLPFPPLRALPDSGMEPESSGSPALQADYLPTEPSGEPYSYMLLLLSRFSRVRLCATPQTSAHQAPPPLGFSRQEHWSGLPFPSPKEKLSSNKKTIIFLTLEDPIREYGQLSRVFYREISVTK